LKSIPRVDVKITDLGSTDNYNEDKILKKYLSIEEKGRELIYKAAVQLAIIGYGNKNFGFIRINDKDIMPLQDIFTKYHIKYLEKLNSKYSDDDLSVRRLLRLFRYQIRDFIITQNRPSYLWIKYADKTNINLSSICFPGGEHLVENQTEALFLMETYEKLDISQNTKFVLRLQRVFIARGIMSPNYFVKTGINTIPKI